MGIVFVDGTVTGPAGAQSTVRFLVDSGVKYSLLPHQVWTTIGLQARRTMSFSLADGTTVQRDISECHLALPQGDGHTPVILGQPSDQALLGVVTLENLGLVLNPFTRDLQPMRMMLA